MTLLTFSGDRHTFPSFFVNFFYKERNIHGLFFEEGRVVQATSGGSPPILHPPIRWSMGGQRVEVGWTRGGGSLLYGRIFREFSLGF